MRDRWHITAGLGSPAYAGPVEITHGMCAMTITLQNIYAAIYFNWVRFESNLLRACPSIMIGLVLVEFENFGTIEVVISRTTLLIFLYDIRYII